MSDQITTAMVDTYKDGMQLTEQQMQSKLYNLVRVEKDMGERVGFDYIGAVKANKKTVRHGDTKHVNTAHLKRWVSMEEFTVADLFSKFDAIKILNDPSGQYARNFIASMNRERDTSIINAALGTSYTGKEGTTAVVLPTAQKIVHGSAGMTLAKIEEAMTMLVEGAAIDPEDPENGLTVAWTRKQEQEFLGITEVKSFDYNTQRVLMNGTIGGSKFYGFNYVRLQDWTDGEGDSYQIIPKASTTRSCVAFVKSAVLLNDPMPPEVKSDELATKDYDQQIWCGSSFGATRMTEGGVVQIDVVEA